MNDPAELIQNIETDMGDDTCSDMGTTQANGPSTVQTDTDETDKLDKLKLATRYLLMNLKTERTSKTILCTSQREN